ncbi:UNVERIFIED_CONTAM: hypothetical protein K2H54_048920 [Gekko kuhli]
MAPLMWLLRHRPACTKLVLPWYYKIGKHVPATVFSQKRKDWDPKRGFLVTSPSFEFFSGMLKCVAHVDGVTFTSFYLPQKVEDRIQNLVLKAEPQKLLVGETLHLMCAAETFVNGRIVFDWKFPRGKMHKPVITLDRSEPVYKATSNVTIQNASMEDRGLYVCRGQIANNTRKDPETNITVTVYREPFLKLSYKKEQNYEAKAGQKMLRLAWKVDAFPRPDVTWYKDSSPIAENSSCYELDPLKYRLVIRDLRAKHAGNYTISLSNAKHGLYESLTSRLVVWGKHLVKLAHSAACFSAAAFRANQEQRADVGQALCLPGAQKHDWCRQKGW